MEETGETAVIGSHDPEVVDAVDTVYSMQDSKLIETVDQRSPASTD